MKWMRQRTKSEIWKIRMQKRSNKTAKKKKNEIKKREREKSGKSLWHNSIQINIRIMWVPGEERESKELKTNVKK